MGDRVIPEAAKRRPPSTEQHAKERYRLSDAWQVFNWEALGDSANPIGVNVTGAVVLKAIKSGPRKGQPNWKTRDPKTEMTLTLFDPDHKAWIAAWEKDTGLCARCEGSGQEWAGWANGEGNRWRTCRVCQGDGKTRAA